VSFNIVIDDAVVEAESLFSPYGKAIIVPGRDISMIAATADALIIRSRTQITDQLLHDNPRIRFIGSTVVGLDHIDEVACLRHDVTLYSAQGCNARSVAEYVINAIVLYALQKKFDFSQLTLAIIGVGHVGKQVEQLASSLGVRVLLNDPFRSEDETHFTHTSLEQCLQQADIVTLHTPLTHKGNHPSYHLINQHNIQYINNAALFINAARGDIVDEAALLTRPDLTLITDCWHNEPYINEQLLAASHLATPHIAGHAYDAKYRGGSMARDALAQWLGKPIITPPIQLPPPSTLNVTKTTPQAQLAQVLQHAYNFAQDNVILKNAPIAQRAQQFEAYRRNYPLRREWHNFQLDNNELHTQTKHWASALGFITSGH
jgi:erythronate-4-phosphate dehydrogenase